MMNLFIVFISLLISATGCGVNQASTIVLSKSIAEICAVYAVDQTVSVKGYRQQDTTKLGQVCQQISFTGGVVVAYGIGEPSDQSGIRCYLTQLPEIDHELTLTKQSQLKQKINSIIAQNDHNIHEFLQKVQVQIFSPINDSTKKILNTDINGFFNKVSILLDEPEIQNMRKYVFCYSDGIQSLNGKDSPANFKSKPKSKFVLCLAGWKTKLPCDSIETIKFEDPIGFLQYLSSNNSFIH